MIATNGRSTSPSSRPEELHLALHQQADALVGDELGDPGGRRVRAVGGAEGVVDVDVGVAGERPREALVVGLLAGRKAQVLQQRHRAGVQVVDHLAGAVADGLVGQGNVGAEQLRQPRGDRLQRILLVRLALGAAEVRGEHHARALLDGELDRGQALADAGVVGDGAAGVERHVEVDADEDPTASDIQLVDGLDRHGLPARPWSAGARSDKKKRARFGAREECFRRLAER